MSPLSPTLAIVICLALSNSALSAQWNLIWAPEANKEGLHAFEGLEDNGSKEGLPRAGIKHIYVEGNNYRFDMYADDSDGLTTEYKQRTEAKGFKIDGHNTFFRKGETWRVTYSMFMPESLKATHSFNSVIQVKQSGVGPPLCDMGLIRRNSSTDTEIIRAKMEPNVEFMHTELTPLRNKWVDVIFEIKVDDAPKGHISFTINSDGKQVVSGKREEIDTFFGHSYNFTQSRPKWGIYRSKSDKANVLDTHLLITKLRAYKFE